MEIDFITAFGRLLRDGPLRDAFTIDARAVAEKIYLRKSDLSAWLQLVPADVGYQANVLMQKRLELVKHFAPETCSRLAERLWPHFEAYGRTNWPAEGSAKICDAFQFCRYLKMQFSESVVVSEWNRLHFALSRRRIAVHLVDLPSAKKKQRGFQLFVRGNNQRWREFFFYLGW